MERTPTRLPGVVILEPRIYRDARGYFLETWQRERLAALGIDAEFTQDNLSTSAAGVLRGLHLQAPASQAKLVSVVAGAIYDVAVDVRAGSPTFGEWAAVELDGEAHRQLFIPAGFAHGFVVTRGPATVIYKVDAPYTPADELTILWDDPDLAISWPIPSPILSEKDRQGLPLASVPPQRLPQYRGS